MIPVYEDIEVSESYPRVPDHEVKRARKDLKEPNVHQLEHRLQFFKQIDNVLMNEKIFWEDWPYSTSHHGYLPEGAVNHYKYPGNNWTFLMKFEGEVTGSSHEVNFLFHPSCKDSCAKPESLWGGKISTEGAWGSWMNSRRHPLRPLFNTYFEQFKAEKGWHYINLHLCVDLMRVKIIQLEEPNRVGGTNVWHHVAPWSAQEQMMLSFQARKGAVRFYLVDAYSDQSSFREHMKNILSG
jgi:hypothetical protein